MLDNHILMPKVKILSRLLVLGTLSLASLALTPRMAQADIAPAQVSALSNGTMLVVRRDRLSPRVAISLLVRAGAADETAESAGWRRLLTDAMLRASLITSSSTAAGASQPANGGNSDTSEGGAGPAPAGATRPTRPIRTPLDRAHLVEQWGVRIGASVGDDTIEFWAVGDSAATGRMLDLLLEIVRQPRLSDQDISRARDRMLARIEAEEDNVAVRASNALVGQLYRDARGAPVAYGLPSIGTQQSLNDLTADKIRSFYRTYFKPSRYVVAAVGDVYLAAIRAQLERMGTPAKPQGPVTLPYFSPPNNSQPPLTVRQMRTSNAWVFVAYVTAGLNSADFPALRVLTAALTQSARARLPKRLFGDNDRRPANGQYDATTYQVAGQLTPRRFAGDLVIFAQTGPQNVDGVKNAILDEVRKLGEKPLTAEELNSAKNYARGNWAVERETLRDRAFQTALATALNAPSDPTLPMRLNKVTAADVQRVARKYLGHYVVALIMPEE